MNKIPFVIVIVILLGGLAGCIGDNNTSSSNRSTVRSYAVDCGEAQTIGNGSCGLTVTSISILGGGGQ